MRIPLVRSMGLVSVLGLLLGCGGETATPFAPAGDPEAAGLYWALTLNQEAVTLSTVAPYDTLQLVATPRDARGNPLTGLGPVTYSSTDSARVQVAPDGLLRALDVGSITVYAKLTAGNTTHTAILRVTVTTASPPPVLAQLSLEPSGGTTVPVNGDGTFMTILGDGTVSSLPGVLVMATATDTAGNPIPEVDVVATSSDTTIAKAFSSGTFGVVMPVRQGRASVVASATAYGVTVADTVEFTFTLPVFAVVKIRSQPDLQTGGTRLGFASSDITISPGGDVVWANVSGQPVDIVFDDPTNVVEHGAVSCEKAGAIDPGGVGNVEGFGEPQDPLGPLSSANCRSRRFPVPGVYPYHSTSTGATGRVVVADGLPPS